MKPLYFLLLAASAGVAWPSDGNPATNRCAVSTSETKEVRILRTTSLREDRVDTAPIVDYAYDGESASATLLGEPELTFGEFIVTQTHEEFYPGQILQVVEQYDGTHYAVRSAGRIRSIDLSPNATTEDQCRGLAGCWGYLKSHAMIAMWFHIKPPGRSGGYARMSVPRLIADREAWQVEVFFKIPGCGRITNEQSPAQ